LPLFFSSPFFFFDEGFCPPVAGLLLCPHPFTRVAILDCVFFGPFCDTMDCVFRFYPRFFLFLEFPSLLGSKFFFVSRPSVIPTPCSFFAVIFFFPFSCHLTGFPTTFWAQKVFGLLDVPFHFFLVRYFPLPCSSLPVWRCQFCWPFPFSFGPSLRFFRRVPLQTADFPLGFFLFVPFWLFTPFFPFFGGSKILLFLLSTSVAAPLPFSHRSIHIFSLLPQSLSFACYPPYNRIHPGHLVEEIGQVFFFLAVLMGPFERSHPSFLLPLPWSRCLRQRLSALFFQ